MTNWNLEHEHAATGFEGNPANRVHMLVIKTINLHHRPQCRNGGGQNNLPVAEGACCSLKRKLRS
jgi:hypothetical protein